VTEKKKPTMPSLDASAFAAAAVPQPDPVQVATTTRPVSRPGLAAEPVPATPAKPVASTGKTPSRTGKVQLNVWVWPETRQKLLHRKADTGESIEEMVSAAIDAMLATKLDIKISG
jgi:hypothetical protein